MFSRDFKRFMMVMAVVLAVFAARQYVFAADNAVEAEGGMDVRDTRTDPAEARQFVRDMNRSLNQRFDPSASAEGGLYDRNTRYNGRDAWFRNDLRGDFVRDYREDLQNFRQREQRERNNARWDVRMSEQARQLQDRQSRADREYQARRQDMLGRMSVHPIGSTEYNRYNNELRRLEERQLERQQDFNQNMRDLQMLESTRYGR